MRDYTRLPEYADDTPLDARLHYAKDLLRRWCRSTYGTGTLLPEACDTCAFREAMDLPKACGWALDANPEKSIRVLEELLGIPFVAQYDTPENIQKIARRNGIETALDLMQEECAELVQAISKRHRGSCPDAEEHVLEEMADVSILLGELCALLPQGEDRMARWRDEKAERTLTRLGIMRAFEQEAILAGVMKVTAEEMDELEG